MAAQHVAEPHRHALHVGVARKGLDEHLADALGAAHDAGGVDGLVGGQLHEPLHLVLAGAHQQVLGAQHVVLDRLGGADLHQRHMLVGRRVEHHRGVVGLKHLVQPLFVPDGADEHGHRDIAAILLLQFHLQLVGAVLVDVKDEQLAGLEPHDLPAQLRADGAAAARHQHRFAGEVAGDLLHVQRHLVAGQKVRRVQLPESPLLGCTAAHQLGVAEQLHGTVGAYAQVDHMAQLAALQGGDGNDDAVDAVALAQLRDLLQRALDRHAVDGLVELGGVIVHGQHRAAILLVGLAHVDGPGPGLARAHDHHGAVGVAAGHAAQALAQRVVQKQPPCQTAAAHQQQDEHRRHAVGRVEQHTVDAPPVDHIHDAGGHRHYDRKAQQVALACVLPQHRVQPAQQEAGHIHGHDPGQVMVQDGKVVGPPGGFHRTVGPQQQRKIKTERHDGGIQCRQHSAAQVDPRSGLFGFLVHERFLFCSGERAVPAAILQAAAIPAALSYILYTECGALSRNLWFDAASHAERGRVGQV